MLQITTRSSALRVAHAAAPAASADGSGAAAAGDTSGGHSNALLDVWLLGWEKFAATPSLPDSVARSSSTLLAVLDVPSETFDAGRFGPRVKGYVEEMMRKLERETGKTLLSLGWSGSATTLGRLIENGAGDSAMVTAPLGSWLRKLLCLVPTQIARAQSNKLVPLVDGLAMTYETSGSVADAVSLAEGLRFGLCEEVIRAWDGPIKVGKSSFRGGGGGRGGVFLFCLQSVG